MGNYRPWGPHGAEGSPLEVTPNPTAQGSFQNIGGADWDASPVATSSGAAGPTHPVSQIAFSLIMVPFVWLFWICLYPMTAAAGIVSGLTVSSVASRFLARSDIDVANFFGIVVGFAVIVVVCRIEYRLAQNAGFRTGRHIVRLIMFGVFGVPWFMGFMGDADARRASFNHMFKMHGQPFVPAATNPQQFDHHRDCGGGDALRVDKGRAPAWVLAPKAEMDWVEVAKELRYRSSS